VNQKQPALVRTLAHVTENVVSVLPIIAVAERFPVVSFQKQVKRHMTGRLKICTEIIKKTGKQQKA